VNSTRTRRSKFEEIDAALKTWFDGIETMGGADLPMTMAVLETRAREIATELGVEGLLGSPGFFQRWASGHRLKSVKLWGQAGSAAEAVRLGERRMAGIRADLATYDPENIYNMDETGFQYRCLPNRSYIAWGRQRRARGSKVMKAKDRVTLVLARKATGSHKIPVAIIGSVAVPLCFKPPCANCPLPYVSQQSAWMDAVVYEKSLNIVFVPEVRARTRSLVILIVDNGGAHTELECDSVKIYPLPPNVMSFHQPLDAGIIACLKRRYKKRVISLVLRSFPEMRRRKEAAAASAASTVAPATAAEAALGARPPSGRKASTPAPSLPARGCGEAGQGAPAGGVVAASAVGAGVVGGAGPIGATGVPGPPEVLVSPQLGAGVTAVAVRGGPLVRLAVPNIGASASSSLVRSPMPPGTVFENGATMDWTPSSAARASLAAGVGFSGTSFRASSATRSSQSGVPPGTPPLVGRQSVPRIPATTTTPVPPPPPPPPPPHPGSRRARRCPGFHGSKHGARLPASCRRRLARPNGG